MFFLEKKILPTSAISEPAPIKRQRRYSWAMKLFQQKIFCFNKIVLLKI